MAEPARRRVGAAPPPFIVGVGAQKAGTTWLHNYLAARPDVWMAPLKEMHFFRQAEPSGSKALLDNLLTEVGVPTGIRRFQYLVQRSRVKSDADYVDYFLRRIRQEHLAFGEITPSYAELNTTGFRKIAEMFEDVRAIFLMRDPVDRFFSAMRMRHSTEELLTYDAVRFAVDQDQYALQSDYPRTIENLVSAFGDGHVLFEFFEHLFSDQALERICRYIGVPFMPGSYDQRVHASKSSARPTAEACTLAREALDGVYVYCRSRFGARVPLQWK